MTVICFAVGRAAEPAAEKGVLDLRELRPDESDVSLDGDWKWYWEKLLRPGHAATPFEYTRLPGVWAQATWQGKPLPNRGYATYELTVLLPPRSAPLAVYMPDVYSAYRLFVNGNELAVNGSPGTSKESTVPFWAPLVKPLPTTSDTLQLLLQVANFHHSKGGPYKSIVIGNQERLLLDESRDRALDFLLTGCLFMGGLFFLGLYWFGRHETSILYFALFCLLYSYRVMGAGEYVLHSLVPGLDWVAAIRLEYLSLFLGVAMFVLYTRSLYPEDVHPLFMKAMAGVCFTFTAVTIICPPSLFSRLITPFLVLMIGYITYAFYVYWKAARNRRPGAEYALMSTGVLLDVFILIIFQYFGLYSPGKIVLFFGYIAFFFLQSLILSYRFAFALKSAKEQAEVSLRAKSDFLSTMSHEIRTPLNSVISMTDMLMTEEPRPDQKQHLDVLSFSANNLLSIVNDILDFNKIEAGKISFEAIPMNLSVIAQNVVTSYRTLAQEKKIELQSEIDPQLHTKVIGDPTRTAQVIINLVHNAIKFTGKGWVRISLRLDARTEKQLTVTVAVEDTGIGIAPEKQKLIFERFTQADSSTSRGFGGTGLGLAICKRILELQGVQLQLNSELQKGSTFYFTQSFDRVPESAPEEVHDKPRPVVGEKPLQGVSILLVEDNKMNVIAVQGYMRRWGATIDVAENGQQALDKLDTTRHQLILMDLHMPVMDGYEATRRLREQGETIPIVALTASLAQEVEDKVRTIGLDDIVVKPFKPDNLLQVILRFARPEVKGRETN